MSAEDRVTARGRGALVLVAFVTYALFILTAVHDFSPQLLLPGLLEAVVLYLVFQGASWARGFLVMMLSILAIELLFSASENLAPGETHGSFTIGRVLGYAASCVLLLRPSVTAFMRHQRITKLLPPPHDGEDDSTQDDSGGGAKP